MFDIIRHDELLNMIHSCESAMQGEECPRALAHFNLMLDEAKRELTIINNEHVASNMFS